MDNVIIVSQRVVDICNTLYTREQKLNDILRYTDENLNNCFNLAKHIYETKILEENRCSNALTPNA